MNIWTLIQQGQFDEACKMADKEYSQTKDILVLRNKIYALFHLEKYEEAYKLGRKIIEITDGKTDVDFVFAGIALWLLGKADEAIQTWGNTEETHYKDAAGGVDIQALLYFAAVKCDNQILKRDVLIVLKRLTKKRRNGNWPTPLATYILGEITKEEMFSKIVNIPILKERQLCQAHFVSAVKELENGNIIGYLASLSACISYGPSSYLEQFYYLAKGELAR